MNDMKWVAIMFIGFALAAALGVGAQKYFESKSITACVNAGGSWIDINPGFSVNMGCVMK